MYLAKKKKKIKGGERSIILFDLFALLHLFDLFSEVSIL